MKESPLVSLILTVYNMEACLAETMDSVVNQTYRNLEIICIDDGSTDSSLEILHSFKAKDNRIIIESQNNSGQGEARNEGLSRANGDYLMLLDSDDVFVSTMVEEMLAQIISTKSDIVVCRADEMDHSSKKLSECPWTIKIDQIPASDPFCCADMNDFIFTAFVGWPWDKLYRRAFIEEKGLRFPALNNSEDFYFVFLSLVFAQRITVIDDVLVHHRVGRSGSVSNSRTKNPLAFYEGVKLLKETLQKDAELYRRIEWGFLNWAFGYTVWNAETLPEGKEKDQLIAMLRNNEFEALETEQHSLRYYSLEASDIIRYKQLILPENEKHSLEPTHAKYPLIRRLATACSIAANEGFLAVFATIKHKLFGEEEAKLEEETRGSSLF